MDNNLNIRIEIFYSLENKICKTLEVIYLVKYFQNKIAVVKQITG